jgi:hypothetical protein
MRNYSGAWVSGSANHKTSNIKNILKLSTHMMELLLSSLEGSMAVTSVAAL